MSFKNIQDFDGVILGYYPLRGRMQVCRLLCEYLHVVYKDLLFTPHNWEEFKNTQAADWNFQQLPFMKDKNLVVTQTFPICLYLIYKANRKQLLGMTTEDQVKVDMFVWEPEIMSLMLGLMATFKDMTTQKKYEAIGKFYQKTIRQKLKRLNSQASGQYFASSLTIADFYIYELYFLFKILNLEGLMQQFPNLKKIYSNLASIPEIQQYEKSSKTIKNICPAEFYLKWKSFCIKQPTVQ